MGAGASAVVNSNIQTAIDESSKEVKDAYAKMSEEERARLWRAIAQAALGEGGSKIMTDNHDGDDEKYAIGPQPCLVRGFTGTARETDSLVALVVDVLKDQGWGGCDRSKIQIQDKSGEGGAKTYKVTALGMDPQIVALHSRSEFVDDPLSEQRMAAAAQNFEAHGLAPRKLAQGGDWFIEVWEGEEVQELHLEKHYIEFGQFLGRLHSTPTAWYDSWRQKLRDAHPCLRDVADGSHLWWYTCRPLDFVDKIREDCRADVFDDYFRPVCPVARRLVSTHGDVFAANMIQTAQGIKAIDFEYSCVTMAAFELAHIVEGIEDEWLWETCREGAAVDDKPKLKRVFLKSYLRSMGEPAGIEDIENLLVDAELFFLAGRSSPVGPAACLARDDGYCRLYSQMVDWKAALAWWKDYVSCVRSGDNTAREELLAHGIRPVRDRFALEQLDVVSKRKIIHE